MIVTQPDSTREIIAKCKRETRIRYKSKGDTFFRPRLRGINYFQVGKSKMIDSPLTIMIEWIFDQFRRVRRAWQRFTAGLFPRRPQLPAGHRDLDSPDRRGREPCHRGGDHIRDRSARCSRQRRRAAMRQIDGSFDRAPSHVSGERCGALDWRRAQKLPQSSSRLHRARRSRSAQESDSRSDALILELGPTASAESDDNFPTKNEGSHLERSYSPPSRGQLGCPPDGCRLDVR
jgi:hypothetical protein